MFYRRQRDRNACGRLTRSRRRTVKRTFAIVAGTMVLSLAVLICSRLSAQGPAAATPPTTKIALINMTEVVNKYEKWKAFKDQIKGVATAYDTKFQQLKKQMEADAAIAQSPTAKPAEREQAEKEIKRLRNEISDLNDEAKKVVGEKQAEQLKEIYIEVQGLAERTAKVRNYDMVLQYNDPFTADPNGMLSLQRKMTSDAFLPLYVAPTMDITSEVVTSLNTWYQQSHNTAPKPAGNQ
jgi:Skp family chaperone for outer membrane proteins